MPPGGRSPGTRAAATHANANVPDENTEINLPMSELSLGDPSTGTGGVDGGQLGTDGVVLKLLLPDAKKNWNCLTCVSARRSCSTWMRCRSS